MVEQISDLPSNVLGFSAKGTITAGDNASIIIPAVEAMFARQARGRFLDHLGKDFSGFEASAMWDDTKLGLRHLAGWGKMASCLT